MSENLRIYKKIYERLLIKISKTKNKNNNK